MPTLHKTFPVCLCQDNISLELHCTMSDQISGDQDLENKKPQLYTQAVPAD